jgi:4'-phosphopantetheinyl transferase EntD
MITPNDSMSSTLVDGFPAELRVACVPLADPNGYRARLRDAEWAAAMALDGKRRIEHVAGRVAARIALEALVGPTDAVIARAADGAPEVLGDNAPLVSISHGHAWAVAVCGYANCLGIDLCEAGDAPRVRRVMQRFVSAEEVALGHETALWALKEAAAKALRRGLLDGGLRASCVASIDPPRFAWPALEANVVYRGGDAIAVVWAA